MKNGYKMGYEQGDMSPHVEDYQPKSAEYSQMQPGKTTEYISRRDDIQSKEASDLKKSAYKGRYQ